jgi:hypothetical protein
MGRASVSRLGGGVAEWTKGDGRRGVLEEDGHRRRVPWWVTASYESQRQSDWSSY